ncbi:TetR/AcrR family transcriptional regulator [Magnetococcus sp. PR-3]|uniref:TetR/AcrR family transcriptional regulator n=1 Tax=Magnetococcus sp. PR-3 TaxID=3120355 RepID=UPI002FCE395E
MADARDPEKTRRKLLEAALEEIHRKGFQAASLSAILERAEMTKGAMYHHFPNKKALGLAVVDELLPAIFEEEFNLYLDAKDSFVEGFIHAHEVFLANRGASFIELGCPVAKLAEEMSPIDEDFRTRVDALYRWGMETMAEQIRQGQRAGNIRSDIQADDASLFIFAAREGCESVLKATQDTDIMHRCLNQLFAFVKSLEPTEQGSSDR